MKSSIQILLSEPLVVEIGAQRVEIRELTWLQLLSFMEKLAVSAARFFAVEGGALRVSTEDIASLVRGSDELSAELLAGSTGLDRAALGALPARAVIVLLEKALEVNLSAEFLAAGKALAARLRDAVPGLAPAGLTASSSA